MMEDTMMEGSIFTENLGRVIVGEAEVEEEVAEGT